MHISERKRLRSKMITLTEFFVCVGFAFVLGLGIGYAIGGKE